MRTLLFLLISFLVLTITAVNVYADASSDGADMWTGFMARQDLFRPHDNFCSASEAFVVVTPNGEGFCIEKDERSATTWEEARNNCVAEFKRLPEPGEFKFACTRAGSLGLNNMTGNWEWSSNFATQQLMSTTLQGTMVAMWGALGCTSAALGHVGTHTTPGNNSLNYRCVR